MIRQRSMWTENNYFSSSRFSYVRWVLVSVLYFKINQNLFLHRHSFCFLSLFTISFSFSDIIYVPVQVIEISLPVTELQITGMVQPYSALTLNIINVFNCWKNTFISCSRFVNKQRSPIRFSLWEWGEWH